MEGKNNKPALRFQGYTDEWEQRRLGEVSASYSGGTPLVGKSEYYGGMIPFIRSGEIGKDHTELFITDEGLTNSSAAMVDVGDILYALYGATSGEVSRSKVKGAINQAILAILPLSGYDAEFLMQCLRMKKKAIVDTFLQGGQGNLSGEIVKNLAIDIPIHEEQVRIAQVLAALDRLIALHQRKCDQLVNVKKSMLRKMFPQNGQKVPEIRFGGFTGEWEQRELGKAIKEFYNGQTPSRQNKEYWDGTINWLSSGDLNRGIVNHTLEKITEKGRQSAGLRIMPKETMVIAIMGLEAAGTRGNCGILGIESTINQACMALVADENVLSTEFLFQWYQCFGDDYALKITQGTKQQNYNSELLGRLSISYPSITEQKAIGRFLSSVDSLISLHMQKLEILKNIKKSMLDKMFV